MKYIFYILSGVISAICIIGGIQIIDWEYWVILGCFIGAYICGCFRHDSEDDNINDEYECGDYYDE